MYGALDIGGTKMTIGLVEGTRVLIHRTLPTQAEDGPESAVARCVQTLRALAEKQTVKAVGIACAGPVNPATGVIDNMVSLPGWERISFTEEMSALMRVPVFIDHDVGTTLLGHVELLKLREKKVLLAMFGTGVGVSVYLNGGLFDNQSGFHPEFGSIRLRPESDPCACGRQGCMDSLLSGPALNRRARAQGFPGFAEMIRSPSEEAESLRRRISEELEIFADTFGIIFQMDLLCFGGGITCAAPAFFAEALASPFRKPFAYRPDCRVMQVQDTGAALVGAAQLCRREGG